MNSFYLATEVVTDNGISAYALAFFTALTTLLGIVAKGVYDTRKTTREAKDEASSANESAQAARENTTSISNGFAGRVVGKLESIERKVDDTNRALRDHLEWHLDKETQK